MKKVSNLALVSMASSFIAQAITITFAGLSRPGHGIDRFGERRDTTSLSFDDLLNGPFGNGFSVWQASSPICPGSARRTQSQFETFAGSTKRLTARVPTRPTLNSIDFAQDNTSQTPGTFTVLFTGTNADNSTVTETLTVNRVAGRQNLLSITPLEGLPFPKNCYGI